MQLDRFHRNRLDRLLALLLHTVALLVVLALVWVLWDVVVQGLGRVSLSYLLSAPSQSGRAGGIAPMIVSTAAIIAVALLVAVPLGVATAVWLFEFADRHARWRQGVGVTLDALSAVPSIVFGLFGSAFFGVYLGLGYSILSGGLTLACMILPIVIRTTESGLAALPRDWQQGGAALGMSRVSLLWHVLLPAAAPALSVGVMLGLGRAAAETAALIFTSGYVDRMPTSLFDSGRSLSVHIYDLSMNVAGGDRAAYAASLVLVLMVVLINGMAHVWLQGWMHRKMRLT